MVRVSAMVITVELNAPISSTTEVTRPAAMAASSGVRATQSAGAPSVSKTSSVDH